MRMKRLNEVFSINDGIFTYLDTLNVPWSEDVTTTVLNMEYHGNHSGKKIVAPIIDSLLEDNVLSSDNKQNLADMIFSLNIVNWQKLYNTLSLEYNPINNYDMTESEQLDNTHSDSGTLSNTLTHGETISRKNTGTTETKNTGTATTANTGTAETKNTGNTTTLNTGTTKTENDGTVSTDDNTTNTTTNTVTSENGIAGFNSSSYSKDRNASNTGNGTAVTDGTVTRTDDLTETRTDNLTETLTNNLTETRTDNLQAQRTDNLMETLTNDLTETDTHSGMDSNAGTSSNNGTYQNIRALKRSGNIGITTSQQMIESERNLWIWRFFDRVFSDIDNVLTIQVY